MAKDEQPSLLAVISQYHPPSHAQTREPDVTPATREGYRPAPAQMNPLPNNQPYSYNRYMVQDGHYVQLDYTSEGPHSQQIYPSRGFCGSCGSHSLPGYYPVRYEPENSRPLIPCEAPIGRARHLQAEDAGILIQPTPTQGPIHTTILVGGRDAEWKEEWIDRESSKAMLLACCVTWCCPVFCIGGIIALLYAVKGRSEPDQDRAIQRIMASKRLSVLGAIISVFVTAITLFSVFSIKYSYFIPA